MHSDNTYINKKVSIIIPCYNVEKYLDECLTSIINQTYKNLEIIVINDGSSDSTPAIIDKYAATDNRIIAIHQENAGVSEARNSGLKVLSGDYICFIDSDDKVLPEYIEHMVNCMHKEQSDIVCVSLLGLNDDTHILTKHPVIPQKTVFYSSRQYILALLNNEMTWMSGIAVWGKLYKKDCFDDVVFPKNLLCEDAYVLYDILSHSRKTILLPECYYIYRTRVNSISHSVSEKYVLDNITWKKKMMSYFNKNTDCEIIDLLARKMCYDILNEYKNVTSVNLPFVKQVYHNSRQIVIKSHTLSFKTRIKYLLHPYL